VPDDQSDDQPQPQEPPTVPVPAASATEPPPAADAPTEAAGATDGPTEAAPTEAARTAAPVAGAADSSGPSRHPGRGRRVLVLLLVLAVGIAGGFAIGRVTADPGPESLADAVSQTAKGDLPVGELDLQELLQSLGRERGGALGQILGGGKGSSSTSGQLGGLVDGLLQQLENRLGDRLGGSSDSGSSGSGTSATSTASLGVRVQAAPEGQSGVVVTEAVAGGAAADAGLRAGDLITKVDAQSVASPAELVSAVRSYAAGDQATIAYTRDGTAATVKVRLGNQSSATTTTRPSTNA
jgi:membrane-associated protease RseP (regulator of RpoE activity)